MINQVGHEASRTLSAIQGQFARLAYLASLQDAPGNYRHWGLAREFGDEEVSRAFHHSHRMVLETVLQTDLAELLGDLQLGAEEEGHSPAEFVEYLLSTPLVRTPEWPSHSHEHFNFVLESLRSLALVRASRS
ncbi:MAG TPA: hypothetical protein VJT08_14905 [Terriglobales bacterium]|nr:hypothetical protein [Terriglobales bacterium]